MFQLAAAQFAAQPAADAMIDFGILTRGEMRTLSDAVQISNNGQDGSAIFLSRLMVEGVASDASLFTSPDFDWARLNRGQSSQLDLKFLGSETNGMYSVRLGFESNEGSVTYTLKATVIPEPESLAVVFVGIFAAMLLRRRHG